MNITIVWEDGFLRSFNNFKDVAYEDPINASSDSWDIALSFCQANDLEIISVEHDKQYVHVKVLN